MDKSPSWKVGPDFEIWPNKTLTKWGTVHWEPHWWIGKIQVIGPGEARAGRGTDMDSIRKAIEIFGGEDGRGTEAQSGEVKD